MQKLCHSYTCIFYEGRKNMCWLLIICIVFDQQFGLSSSSWFFYFLIVGRSNKNLIIWIIWLIMENKKKKINLKMLILLRIFWRLWHSESDFAAIRPRYDIQPKWRNGKLNYRANQELDGQLWLSCSSWFIYCFCLGEVGHFLTILSVENDFDRATFIFTWIIIVISVFWLF